MLIRSDPDKPTFLKSYCSTEGMCFIRMHPASNQESIVAIQLLCNTGEYVFDINKSGARLQPVLFGSRCCNGLERQCHSFVGEAACDRWALNIKHALPLGEALLLDM